MLLMFSLPLRHSLRLRRCVHCIVFIHWDLTLEYYVLIPLILLIALLRYYMVWIL